MDKDITDLINHLHDEHTGVLDITGLLPVTNSQELALAYTPGVATLAKEIAKDYDLKNKLTISGKLVAVITDGTAVLGLGNIGPAAGLPIVEGKALLYKELGGVTAIPLCVDQVSAEEIIKTIKNISSSFAGIHLEDIAAPSCFEIEEVLKQELDIPVYHDDQEGTATVVLAGLINAAKVVHKSLKDLKIVINGVGASGLATARLLYNVGITNLTLVDKYGVVTPYDERYNKFQKALAAKVPLGVKGDTLKDVIADKDVFIGLSDANVLSADDVRRMAKDPIIFALANPVPEILPDEAKKGGAAVVATGSSQYPNQINNILVFPGLFKGLLEAGIKCVDFALEEKIAETLASLVKNPSAEDIIPSPFDCNVAKHVSEAVLDYNKNV